MARKGEGSGGGTAKPATRSNGGAQPNARSMAWALLLLRVFLGAKFLQSGLENWPWLGTGKLAATLTAWTTGDQPVALSSYVGFLTKWVIPHAPVFTGLVVIGEILVGVCLILGLTTRLAALPALMMSINFLLATWNRGMAWQGINEAFILIELALLIAGAGRFVGFDVNLARKYPQWPLW